MKVQVIKNSKKRETASLIDTFIEVNLINDDSFLKIKETLTRIGIANSKNNRLSQTAHILQKRGKYYIVHFMQLFALDGKSYKFDDADKRRINAIAQLLESWGLLTIKSDIAEEYKNIKPYHVGLKLITHQAKQDWNLVPKYTIGSV